MLSPKPQGTAIPWGFFTLFCLTGDEYVSVSDLGIYKRNTLLH